eukprot:2367991-Amphidinium_carterae.2
MHEESRVRLCVCLRPAGGAGTSSVSAASASFTACTLCLARPRPVAYNSAASASRPLDKSLQAAVPLSFSAIAKATSFSLAGRGHTRGHTCWKAASKTMSLNFSAMLRVSRGCCALHLCIYGLRLLFRHRLHLIIFLSLSAFF